MGKVTYPAELAFTQICDPYLYNQRDPCCYDANGDIVVGSSGVPINFPWCDPAFCDPAYTQTLSQEDQDFLALYCPQVGDTLPIPVDPTPTDCLSPDAEQCTPPNVVTGSAMNFTEDDVVATSLDVKFGSGFTSGSLPPSAMDLLIRGVALLRANPDLIAYACCLYFGPDAVSVFPGPVLREVCDCILEELFGKIKFVFHDREYRCARFSSLPGHINVYSTLLVDKCGNGRPTVADWDLAVAAGDTGLQRLILLSVACGIAHELSHRCVYGDAHKPRFTNLWLGDGTDWQKQNCDLTVLFQDGPFGVCALLGVRYPDASTLPLP